MCNVRAEDTGEIKFVARHIKSVAYLKVEGIKIMNHFVYTNM